MTMTLRQAYALAHPISEPSDDLGPLRAVTAHPTRRDAVIMSILSVDR